ncbi:MAG: hypothetical protein RR063_09105 [Anaerovoracaceae bacterium]
MLSRLDLKTSLGLALIVIGGIYLSGHSYSIIASTSVKIFMLMLCFVGCLLLNSKMGLPRHVTAPGILIFTISVGSLLSFAFYPDKNSLVDPLLLIGIMIVSHMITKRISFDRFARLFSNLMLLLTGVAIAVWIMVASGLDVPGYSYISPNGFTYKTIWICSWLESGNRFMGPFWESGLYASFAVFAALLEMCFTGRKPRVPHILVFSIGVFLSMSTAGYLLLALVFYIAFRKSRSISYLWDLLVIALTVLGFIYLDQIFIFLYSINPDVFWKMVEGGVTLDTRLLSPYACFEVFKENPATGLGMSFAIEKFNIFKSILNIDSLTSTSIFMLAAFGVWGVSYTAAIGFAAFKQKDFSVVTRVFLLILLLAIVNKEPHYNLMITYVIVFYLCQNSDSIKSNKLPAKK